MTILRTQNECYQNGFSGPISSSWTPGSRRIGHPSPSKNEKYAFRVVVNIRVLNKSESPHPTRTFEISNATIEREDSWYWNLNSTWNNSWLTENWFVAAPFKFHSLSSGLDQIEPHIFRGRILVVLYLHIRRELCNPDCEAECSREAVAVTYHKRARGWILQLGNSCNAE